ncbi:hypothetical protein ACFE04_017722 [Oxalis oulophora]
MALSDVQSGYGDRKTQFDIKTKNLSYKFPEKTSFFSWKKVIPNKYILRNVTCEAMPGKITAIAGPSGAGKTTLLEVLAGVIPWSRVYGDVLVNDKKMEASHFRKLSGYVTQDDILFPLLTVKEMLLCSAYLRLSCSREKAEARVEELVEELGLEHVSNQRIGCIGGSHRGISGGEKRRVSIGVDLVHEPSVLLLDEPTSGLDSASALGVAFLLKTMAREKGKTIVLTVHQPGFQLLELFDQILLLSHGAVLHQGPLFVLEQKLIFSGHSIPDRVNGLEFAIQSIEARIIGCEQSSETNGSGQPLSQLKRSGVNIKENKFSYPNSRFSEILTLSQRFFKNIFRTKQLFTGRLLQSIVTGLALGTLFMNGTRSKLQTQIGFFAFSITFLVSSTAEGLPIFLQERKILMRETSRGAYRISSYVISNTLVYFPFLLAVTLSYTIPVYWLVGLRKEIDGFLYFSLVLYLVVLMSNSFIACFSALVPDFIMGTTIISGVLGTYFLFSGYFIRKEDIPSYWIFMHYLSLFKYPLESLVINQYGGSKTCFENIEGECFVYGNVLLAQQGLKESQKWSNIGIMWSFVIGYRFLCYVILRYRLYKTRY